MKKPQREAFEMGVHRSRGGDQVEGVGVRDEVEMGWGRTPE